MTLTICQFVWAEKGKKRKRRRERKKERKKKKFFVCFSIQIPMSPMRPGLPISGLQIEISKLGPVSRPDPGLPNLGPRPLRGFAKTGFCPPGPARRSTFASPLHSTAEATRTSFPSALPKTSKKYLNLELLLLFFVVFTCIGKKPSCWIREEI